MLVDGILLAVTFVMAVYGYRKGFVHQCFMLIGVAMMMFFSAPLAGIVENILKNEYQIYLPTQHLRSLLAMGCGGFIFVMVSFVGNFLYKTLVKGIKPIESTNRILGAVLGLFSALLALYFILGVVATASDKLAAYAPDVSAAFERSVAYQSVERNNIVPQFEFFSRALKKRPHGESDKKHADSEDNRTEVTSVRVDKNLEDSARADGLLEKSGNPPNKKGAETQ